MDWPDQRLTRDGQTLTRDEQALVDALCRVKKLTPREREVFNLLGLGLSNRLIGWRLELSEPRVKAHVTRILNKLDLQSRTQAAIVAFASRRQQEGFE